MKFAILMLGLKPEHATLFPADNGYRFVGVVEISQNTLGYNKTSSASFAYIDIVKNYCQNRGGYKRLPNEIEDHYWHYEKDIVPSLSSGEVILDITNGVANQVAYRICGVDGDIFELLPNFQFDKNKLQLPTFTFKTGYKYDTITESSLYKDIQSAIDQLDDDSFLALAEQLLDKKFYKNPHHNENMKEDESYLIPEYIQETEL